MSTLIRKKKKSTEGEGTVQRTSFWAGGGGSGIPHMIGGITLRQEEGEGVPLSLSGGKVDR